MANKRTFVGVVGIAVSSLILTACGGGGSSGGEEGTVVGVQGGTQVVADDVIAEAQEQRESNQDGGTQVVAADVIAEAQEQRESNQDEESGPQTLSTDDVEVEELNEAPAEEEVEDGIEVSEAEEDPLDGLLNAVATFQGCLEDDGFEFIGAPGQPGPDGETVDPSEFTPEYLGALQKCATESNILENFQNFNEAQENLTPEQITALNFGLPTFGECLERLGWEVGELVPDERGALSFGANGTGLTPPEGTDDLFPIDDINACRQEATAYTEANYVPEEES